MSINSQYLDKAKPIVVRSEQGAIVAYAECADCDARDRWRLTALPEPGILQRHFSVRGWTIRRRAVCPQCKSKKEVKQMSNIAKIDPKPVQKLPTPDARAQRREAHGMIELCFDIGKGCYREGYSDARIANETGAAVAWVKQRREEEFGPLKQPAEIAELSTEIETIAARLAAAREKLSALVAKNGWAA